MRCGGARQSPSPHVAAHPCIPLLGGRCRTHLHFLAGFGEAQQALNSAQTSFFSFVGFLVCVYELFSYAILQELRECGLRSRHARNARKFTARSIVTQVTRDVTISKADSKRGPRAAFVRK